ncbi:MAG: CCA tRNA nucleotidyltransferase [Cyanobacteria bacterium J06597_1]
MTVSTPTIPLPFPLELLPQPAYLVGGAVRDWLLGRTVGPILDIDLVVERDAIAYASGLAKQLGGGFVVLDDARHISRIVLDNATIDVAQQAGHTVEDDLALRDFTCNAIALELHTDRWIDPLNGRQDVRDRQLRMVHPDNLTADPLRLLRGYRQAAQLGFSLTEDTRQATAQRHHLLKTVAAERVRTELHYLLELGDNGLNWLKAAWEDRQLTDWLPELEPTSFQTAAQLPNALTFLQEHHPASYDRLKQPICDRRSGIATIFFAVLFLHISSDRLNAIMQRLKYSRIEQQWGDRIATLVPKLIGDRSADYSYEKSSRSNLLQLFESAGKAFPAVALAALAAGVSASDIAPLLSRYENPQDPLAHQVPLIDGRHLIQSLNLKSSPTIGLLLKELKLAQADCLISTQEEAIEYAQEWLEKQ